jgi:predicted transposase YbfD/YdcC
MNTFKQLVADSFSELEDYRIAQGQRHPFINLIVISVCAVIANATDESDIAEYGKAKLDWFSTFLDLPYGIPSQSTFERFFAAINPQQLERCFIEFTKKVPFENYKEHIAIDGKTIRSSYDTASDKPRTHIVSAFATKFGITLAQVKTDAKSNEITAIPELLDMINIEGSTISMDAMGTQKSIAQKIIRKKGDYVLSVKDNHPKLAKEVEAFFEAALKSKFQDIACESFRFAEKGHGRIEVREYYICSIDHDCVSEKQYWEGVKTIIMTTTERHHVLSGKTSIETRFFISSLGLNEANEIHKAIRQHWGVENSLHYVLDVTFKEDASRIRINNAAENFSVMRRLALNVIRCTKAKGSIKARRMRAALNDSFMENLLRGVRMN